MRRWIVLVAAALIAVAIYAASLNDRYEIAGNAPTGWLLDKRTGNLEFCYLKRNNNPFSKNDPNNENEVISDVVCEKEIHNAN